MTDHHNHDFGDDHGAHGVPVPPTDEELRRHELTEIRGSEPVPLHFFKGPGPMNVEAVKPRRIKLRDGTSRTIRWRFHWYLDRVEGTTRAKALRALYDVLLAPQGWTRAGVQWARTMDPAKADIVVRVIPQDTTVCGPGSAGCYSWGGGKPPAAEMGVEYIDRPGPWAALVGMELQGHGTFRADDQYFAVHQPYPYGVMGSWAAMASAGYFPTEAEIQDTITWLEGNTPADRIHWH